MNKPIKNYLRNFLTGTTVGLGIFAGILTALAVYPPSPDGANSGGWLANFFDLDQSSDAELVINGNISLSNSPQKGNHIANKDYIDNKITDSTTGFVSKSYVDSKVNASSGNFSITPENVNCKVISQQDAPNGKLTCTDPGRWMMTGGCSCGDDTYEIQTSYPIENGWYCGKCVEDEGTGERSSTSLRTTYVSCCTITGDGPGCYDSGSISYTPGSYAYLDIDEKTQGACVYRITVSGAGSTDARSGSKYYRGGGGGKNTFSFVPNTSGKFKIYTGEFNSGSGGDGSGVWFTPQEENELNLSIAGGGGRADTAGNGGNGSGNGTGSPGLRESSGSYYANGGGGGRNGIGGAGGTTASKCRDGGNKGDKGADGIVLQVSRGPGGGGYGQGGEGGFCISQSGSYFYNGSAGGGGGKVWTENGAFNFSSTTVSNGEYKGNCYVNDCNGSVTIEWGRDENGDGIPD